MSKRVLILCTGNSCRSQMAEGLWRHHGGGTWESESAGSRPTGYVHPLSVKAMDEAGIDISDQKSKHLDQFLDQAFDVVVTVCDNAANDCPTFHNATQSLHWPFDDPGEAEGTEEEQMAAFREVRDAIAARIQEYLGKESGQASGDRSQV